MPTYQLLVQQPLAAEVNPAVPQPLALSHDEKPLVVMRPLHNDETQRLAEGGTRIGLEFESEQSDLLRAAKEGLLLLEDFLSSLSLTSGVPFLANTPLQIVEFDEGDVFRFVRFLPFSVFSWQIPLDSSVFEQAAHLRRHWNELTDGHRARRAARRYRRVLATEDPLDAFQHAFTGLEILEKQLAAELGVPHGSENATAICPECGASFEYKRSALVGVRAFVQGALHADRSEERDKDWTDLSGLRNDLAHGLQDIDQLEGRAEQLLAAAAHYLHDAGVHLGHLHDLETNEFRLHRLGRRLVMMGEARLPAFPSLIDQVIFLDAQPMRFVRHELYGTLPEYALKNNSGGAVEAGSFLLDRSLMDASEQDLRQIEGVLA